MLRFNSDIAKAKLFSFPFAKKPIHWIGFADIVECAGIVACNPERYSADRSLSASLVARPLHF